MYFKNTLVRTFFLATLTISLIGIASLSAFFIFLSLSDFNRDVHNLQADYLESHKTLIREEAEKAVRYIKRMRSETENRLKESIRTRVYEAHAIATRLYQENHGIRSEAEIAAIIKGALRPVRFHHDRGYYFVTNLNGVAELSADRPELEGLTIRELQNTQGKYIIKEMISIAQKSGEGFYQYTWTKPHAKGREFLKIAFVKQFKPLNWLIGMGEYREDVEKDIQLDAIKHLETITFAQDGYVFAGQWDGISLTNPAKGKDMYEVTDIHGVKIVQGLIGAARKGGGFVEYVMPKFEGKRPLPKISYAQGIVDWKWYVGAGVYIDEIDSMIAAKKSALTHEFRSQTGIILGIILLSIILALISAFWFYRILNRELALFGNFFQEAASSSGSGDTKIDIHGLHFEEFQKLASAANVMIDHRKTAEEELKTNEQFLRLITDNIQDAIRVIDLKTLRYTYANPYATTLFGMPDREYINSPLGFNLEEADRQRLFQIIHDELEHDAERKRNRFRLIELREKNQLTGETIWTENKASFIRDPDGKPTAILSIVRDITERRQAERTIQESEERLRKAQTIAHVGNWEIDLRTGKLWASDEAFRIYGNKRVTPEMPLEAAQQFVLPQYRAQLDLALQRLIRREGAYDEEFQITRASDGELRFIHSRAELVLAEDGTPVKVAGAIQDISEQKRSEHAILAAEKRFRNLLENIQLVAIILDSNGNISFCNDYFLNLTGWSRDEVLNRSWFDLFIPKEIRSATESVFHVNVGAGAFVSHYENTILTHDGSSRQIVWDNTALTDPEGRVIGIAGIGIDVTEHRKLEDALRRSEKMEALGQLAGGVAHDLNNVLGVLVGYAELLREKIPEGNPLKRYAANILTSSEKGALIIQDLLTLARRGVSAADVVNLNRIVSGFLRTPVFEKLQDYHPRVTFRTELDPGLMNIKGSPIHLEKTAMNLISNAAEAIAGSGEVVIRTENRYVDKAIRGYDNVQEGDYVVLTVLDSGSGIAAADLDKIFEPFYTKKVMGRSGSGLGLAVVWGTVKDHNGYIDVQSADGKGSTFTLYFPVTREEMADDSQKMPIPRCMGRGESILVVDDVAAQKEMAAAMLASLDYRVHSVSSGEEAVAYLKTHTVDLMVLDMIMDPGIDGLETYKRALEINPKQKAIIVSGFSETDRVRQAQHLGAGPYVKKPYVLEKIALAIRNELRR